MNSTFANVLLYAILALAVATVLLGWRRRPQDSIIVIAAWLVPGAGHWLKGRRGKAALFFCLIVGTFFAGALLTWFKGVRFEDNPFYFVGRWGCGLTFALSTWLISPDRPLAAMRLFEPGILYMCVAGLLNVVILISLLEEPDKRQDSADRDRPREAPRAERQGDSS